MEGCDSTFDYCPAIKGTKARGTIEFTSTAQISQLDCYQSASGYPIGINCPVKDGCKSIMNGTKCPIPADTKIVYNMEIAILDYPVSSELQNYLAENKVAKPKQILLQIPPMGNVHLKDGGIDVICLRLPIKIEGNH